MRQPAAALMSIIVPRIVGGLGTGEPRTQLAGRVESKSPRPSFGGRCVGLFCPARARRARRHKAANPYRLDFSCTALKVAPRVSSVSFCQFIPSPPALSPTHSWPSRYTSSGMPHTPLWLMMYFVFRLLWYGENTTSNSLTHPLVS